MKKALEGGDLSEFHHFQMITVFPVPDPDQDPVNPVGYIKTRFMCAANHSGYPESLCAADFNDQCNPTYSFYGCNEVVPCAPPRPGGGRTRLASYSAEELGEGAFASRRCLGCLGTSIIKSEVLWIS